MKNSTFFKYGWLVIWSVAISCNKNTEAGTEPIVFERIDLAEILSDGHWQEQTYFVYEEEGNETLSDPLDSLHWRRTGEMPEDDCRLAIFAVDTARWLLQHYPSLSIKEGDQTYGFYRPRRCMVKLGETASGITVCFDSSDELIRQKSWVVGEEMHVLQASRDEVVLESPVKAYTREMWAEDMWKPVRCLRSVWTRVEKPRDRWFDFFETLREKTYWREVRTGFVRLERGFAVLDPNDLQELSPAAVEFMGGEALVRLGTVGFFPDGKVEYFRNVWIDWEQNENGEWVDIWEWWRYEKKLSYGEDVYNLQMSLWTEDDQLREKNWIIGSPLTFQEPLQNGESQVRFTCKIKPAIRKYWTEFIDQNTIGMYTVWEPVEDEEEIAELENARRKN